jgi:hypothetical protein
VLLRTGGEARVVVEMSGIVCKQQCEMQVRGAAYE